jgi:hypothetical protein
MDVVSIIKKSFKRRKYGRCATWPAYPITTGLFYLFFYKKTNYLLPSFLPFQINSILVNNNSGPPLFILSPIDIFFFSHKTVTLDTVKKNEKISLKKYIPHFDLCYTPRGRITKASSSTSFKPRTCPVLSCFFFEQERRNKKEFKTKIK